MVVVLVVVWCSLKKLSVKRKVYIFFQIRIIALLKSTKKWSTFTTLSKTGFWTFISKSNLSYPYMFVCVFVLWFCWFFWYLERDEGTFNLTCFIFKVFFLQFFFFSWHNSQFELIGNTGGNVFKGGRGAWYTLETDPIQT